jgi:glucose-1-phosphatase
MNHTFKAIVFDFGNVIININVELTIQAFAKITGKNSEKVKALFEEFRVFKRYESGEFSDDEFRDLIRSIFNQPLTSAEIDLAWNALLLDIPLARINLLQDLRKQYPVYLLSNTSNIHIQAANRYLFKAFKIQSLLELFDEIYLSYELELWKPDVAIYQHVAKDLKLSPNEILFFDDNVANIEASKQFGFQSVLIKPGEFEVLDFKFGL